MNCKNKLYEIHYTSRRERGKLHILRKQWKRLKNYKIDWKKNITTYDVETIFVRSLKDAKKEQMKKTVLYLLTDLTISLWLTSPSLFSPITDIPMKYKEKTRLIHFIVNLRETGKMKSKDNRIHIPKYRYILS